MKFPYFIIVLPVILLTTAACEKSLTVSELHGFNVETEKAVFAKGEEVIFSISGGEAHAVSFYSGEPLKDYEFREGREVDITGSRYTMTFQNSVQVGNQPNQFSVLYSTEFDGDYTSLNSIKAASWTDITNRFSPLATGTAFVTTTKDITDLVQQGKPIYIAFRYITRPQMINGAARQWFIQNFAISSDKTIAGATSLMLSSQANSGFRIVDEFPEKAPARSVITDTRISLYGNVFRNPNDPIFNPENPVFDPLNPIYDPKSQSYNPTATIPVYQPFDPTSPYNDPLAEHWAISKAINTDKVKLQPDFSTPIKGLSQPPMKEFRYAYQTPGQYTAVFVATNNSVKESRRTVIKVNLQITQ